jgi:hypothetical protein
MVEKTESKYGWLEVRCSGNHVVRRAICARAWVGRTYYYPPAEIEAHALILLINTANLSVCLGIATRSRTSMELTH